MKKVLFLLLILIFSYNSFINAQGASKKWAIVQDLDDRIVYLDTTTIREFDNKITIWSLVSYKTPQEIKPLQQKVSQIRSQFMINSLLKKYSVIGTLYYDSKGRMIGESAIPNYNFNTTENFQIAIVEGSTIDVLHNKAKDYLATGEFGDGRSDFIKNYYKNNPDKNAGQIIPNEAVKDSIPQAKPKQIEDAVQEKLKEVTQVKRPVDDSTVTKPPVKIDIKYEENLKKDTVNSVKSVDDIVNTKIDSSKIVDRSKKLPRDTTALGRLKKELEGEGLNAGNPKTIENENVQKPAAEKLVNEKISKPAKTGNVNNNVKSENLSGYDFSRETNPSGVIFTDGRLYCFQVSSWKIKSQADRETARLKSAGHNAFIQEANVPGKGKWYRVRIGYFNSLQDASDYRKKVR